jgi:hypothetical protein
LTVSKPAKKVASCLPIWPSERQLRATSPTSSLTGAAYTCSSPRPVSGAGGSTIVWGKASHRRPGVYPTVTLAEARAKRLEIKKQIADGINPSAKRKIDKITGPLANVNSFRPLPKSGSTKPAAKGGRR